MFRENLSARGFTDSATRILEQVAPRACDRGMFSLDDEMLAMVTLWAMLRWELKVGIAALERIGVDLDALAKHLNASMHQLHQQPFKTEVQQLPSGKQVQGVVFEMPLESFLNAAASESTKLEHRYIGTEHLLLAIIAQGSPNLQEVLNAHGVEYERVKAAILEILQP